jgi:hypothetical protein
MSKENKKPSFSVEAGRIITKNGKDYVRIAREDAHDNDFSFGSLFYSISPTEADELTHLIAKLLNEHFAKNAV